MKVSPYLSFNGNCAEAIAFYEKAFNVKSEVKLYKDAPEELKFAPDNLVYDAQFRIGNDTIMLHDLAPEAPATIGDNIMITIKFDEADTDKIKAVFNALKEGGEVTMELGEVSWSKCFGLLIDKFGVNWNVCQN